MNNKPGHGDRKLCLTLWLRSDVARARQNLFSPFFKVKGYKKVWSRKPDYTMCTHRMRSTPTHTDLRRDNEE